MWLLQFSVIGQETATMYDEWVETLLILKKDVFPEQLLGDKTPQNTFMKPLSASAS